MDYQQSHGYMRPPPPPQPSADPYQRPPPPVPPPPSNHSWSYPAAQFQYHPQAQHSPSPPPPQWPPPPDHAPYPHPPYTAHQAPPYAANPRYPAPHPLPPRAPHVPRSQDWASGSWNQHLGWQYPTNNEEDWAAKARAWAAAKAATENQQGQSQFVQAGRPEEQNHLHDQYPQPIDHQYHDGHAPLAPPSNYQPYPVGHPGRTGQGHFQNSQYPSSGQPSYAGDMRMPFAARDGNLAADSVAPFQQQEKSSISPLTHQQEVPSSYSSVAGKEEAGDKYEKFNVSAALPAVSVSPNQPLPPAGGRAGWMEETHTLPGNHPAEPATDLSDQPLNFAPHFNRQMDPHAPPIYTHSSVGPVRGGDVSVPVSSNYAWTPSSMPRAVYPPVHPTAPTGPQVDHPIGIPSPASGHSASIFPAGSGFQPVVPMIGTTFGVGAGVSPHSTAFPRDTYGISERPKKASVPNWLREEIIKNKAVITSSTPGIPKEDTQSIDEDSDDKSYRKGDQADSKSADSSRSTEDEDEDEVEAARAAAINKEIKRVLTEVLLKVTDELFDEIASKVLNEDDLSVEVGQGADLSDNHKLSSTPSVLTPKSSAKVFISTKAKESGNEDASQKSISGAPGDILGLASYASDEEEEEDEEEIQSSSKLNSKKSVAHQQSSGINYSQRETEEHVSIAANLETGNIGGNGMVSANPGHGTVETDLNVDGTVKELASNNHNHSSKIPSGTAEERLHHGSDISRLNIHSIEDVEGVERPDRNLDTRSLTSDDSRIQNARKRFEKNDSVENRSSMVKLDGKDSERFGERSSKKGDEDRRHVRTERIGYPDKSNDKMKDKGRTDEKGKHIESRKRPSPSTVKDRTEAHRDKRTAAKNDSDDKKPDRVSNEKEERSRHKIGSESSRRKEHHSSGESSDGSKRKSRHTKRHKSPSPIRPRKRQVSRSPHSKQSKRRHSPYSSLETTRGKRSSSRSLSRSPIRRRR